MGVDAEVTELKNTEEALRLSNRELEAFSYSVSHDLRSPLAVIDGFSRAVLQKYGDKMDPESRSYLDRVRARTIEMAQLIEDLLSLARVMRTEIRYETVDLALSARRVIEDCRNRDPQRQVEVDIQEPLVVRGDQRLLVLVLENLIGNAWKFTSKLPVAHISVGSLAGPDRQTVYFIKDDGAGFDMAYSDKLFGTFQRLHAVTDFPGSGVGLATMQSIISRHGGRVWAESKLGQGATFFFVLGNKAS
ncbi:MAG: ATP-binding protein [Candidatus Protistobacter heckmanni]|nr:ATP-binding protein [Candidatus Protistobacter heckmanni]